MKKVSLAILISLGALSGAAYAQQGGVTMSTRSGAEPPTSSSARKICKTASRHGNRASPRR